MARLDERHTGQESGPALLHRVAFPLGSLYDGCGVSFAVHVGEGAKNVDLVLFDPVVPGKVPQQMTDVHAREPIPMVARDDGVWQTYVPGLKPGQLYGYRVNGPFRPWRRQLFDPEKILADPYAKAAFPDLSRWNAEQWREQGDNRKFNALSAVVFREKENLALENLPAREAGKIESRYGVRWQQDTSLDRPLETEMAGTVIYKLNIDGFSAANQSIPASARGTFTGLAHHASISYLKQLGVTDVELQPIHFGMSEAFLRQRGLINEWNYNPLLHMAIHPRYGMQKEPQRLVNEVKYAIRCLHKQGIGVILDMVFPHSGEGALSGDSAGPTVALRGRPRTASST